jgi:hypothetical protein
MCTHRLHISKMTDEWRSIFASVSAAQSAAYGRSRESIRKKPRRDAGYIGRTTVESSAALEMYRSSTLRKLREV